MFSKKGNAAAISVNSVSYCPDSYISTDQVSCLDKRFAITQFPGPSPITIKLYFLPIFIYYLDLYFENGHFLDVGIIQILTERILIVLYTQLKLKLRIIYNTFR